MNSTSKKIQYKLSDKMNAQATIINIKYSNSSAMGVRLSKIDVELIRHSKVSVSIKENIWNEIICFFVKEGTLYIRTHCEWNADDTALTGEGYSYKIISQGERTGDCVEKSANLYLKMRKLGGVKLIQGEVWSRAGNYKNYNKKLGCPIYHSWVEWNGKVYDYSQNQKIVADWDIYYAMMRVKRTIELVPEIKDEKLVERKYNAYIVKKGKKGEKERRVLEDVITCFGTGEQEKKRFELINSIKSKQLSAGLVCNL